MTTALIVFLNVFFIAFVLVAVVGLLARGLVSDKATTATTASTASTADQRVRGRTAFPRRASHRAAPARRQPRRALDLGA